MNQRNTAEASKTVLIGGNLPVNRMGYGSMRLTGPGIWGPPQDERNALAILQRAVELGINIIDTADVYGPDVTEILIRKALAPYAPGLIIATKGGMVRSGAWTPTNPGMSFNGSESHIRHAVEGSLRNLGIERIDLYQLHRIDPSIPVEDTMGVFRSLRDEGKIRYIGLSEVSVAELQRAQSVVEIASVQNIYNLSMRKHEDVVAFCAQNGIAFISFWPLHSGALAESDAVNTIAHRIGATRAQVALAWLLKRSPAVIAIPGTTSIAHLEQNVAATNIELSNTDMEALDKMDGQ